jgi:hypothetical protein
MCRGEKGSHPDDFGINKLFNQAFNSMAMIGSKDEQNRRGIKV